MKTMTESVVVGFLTFLIVGAIFYLPCVIMGWSWNPGDWHWVLRTMFGIAEFYVAYKVITSDK